MESTQTGNTITLTKTFSVSREALFAMFTEADKVAQWWGPAEWPATVVSFDFKTGGSWHYYMQGPDGTKAWGKGLFLEVDEPRKLVMKDVFSNEAGDIDETLPQGQVTFEFVPQEDDTTLLRMTGEYPSEADAKKLVEMGMIDGMKQTWGQLEALVTA